MRVLARVRPRAEGRAEGAAAHVAQVLRPARARRQDVRRFVSDLEDWTIRTLGRFSVTAERRLTESKLRAQENALS
mgnify:CR=1 FL=1